ncbi:MAG: LysR family transcriptional regulator [Oscillospiraceae bacterium]|nr:LysR family transcriptional regulator [Oscillospiraceae bacterium]
MEHPGSSTNFESYKIFYFVAQYGSITTAAQRLYVTQPTVTKAVHKLEEQLNCALFVRTRRGVRLTPEGELLW